MATEQDLTVFARLRLAPFIKEAIQAAVVARPSDTVDFVIEYLTKNRDNLKRGLITEAINYVKAGGKMENGADEELLKQYDNIKKRLDAVTNVGRAEVARLKDLNTHMKHDMTQIEEQLQLANAELETARARITELEAQLAAAAAAAAPAATFAAAVPSSAADDESEPVKGTVLDDREGAAVSKSIADAQELEVAARKNPFQALGDIGMGEAESQLVAFAGEHGYAVVFGADSAEGEPSARTQLVENTAAALTAAGTSVAVHKLDISDMDTDSAFVVLGEDGSHAPGPFVASLQQCGTAAAADPATVVWLLLVGNNGSKTLETLKAAVFSNTIVQTITGDITLTDNIHLIVETGEEDNIPLPCHWVKV